MEFRNQFSTSALALALVSIGAPAERAIPLELSRRTEYATRAGNVVEIDSTVIGTAQVVDLQSPALNEWVTLNESRPTTLLEEIIGQIRAWATLGTNWDGEGANAPIQQSMVDAVLFLDLLPENELPEPMMLASGCTGLYWNDNKRYADLEFLGDGRVTYYIEHPGIGKHKGVVQFRKGKMPAVFSALLAT